MPVEGRDLSSRQTQDVGKDRRLGNLATPISVQKLQKALHAKAKAEPSFRCYLTAYGLAAGNTPLTGSLLIRFSAISSTTS
jgi:hypothetical protein